MELLGIILNMLISHSRKFIYIKTKKTAGSSIESIIVNNFFDHSQDICTGSKIDDTPRVNIGPKLPNQPDGHRPWEMVKELVGCDVWNEYTKFTVERNPWDKVVSEFYWKTEREPQLKVSDDDKNNFEYFVDNCLGKWFAAPQDWKLYAYQDKIMVDEVLQYNNLANELVTLFNQLGMELTHDMVTGTNKKSGFRKKHYTSLYNDRLIDIVGNGFRNEINHFGYKFGD